MVAAHYDLIRADCRNLRLMSSQHTMLALVPDAFGGRGGIAQYNRDFLAALSESSSISVLVRNAPDRVALPAGIVQMPPQPNRIAYALSALKMVLQRRFDVIFCGHLHMAPLAWLLAILSRAKLIVQMHGVECWSRPSDFRRRATEAADLVLCVSRYTRGRVLSWAAITPEKTVVLPNTLREDFTPGDSSALRLAWGLQGKRVILSVGRVDRKERYKGHDLLLEIIPQLVRAGFDIAWVVVGEGSDLQRLQEQALAIGLADRVRFTGALELNALVEVYRMVDLFVLPSTGEGFGIAFLEAMACGTPALGLAAAGALDALADGELGAIAAETSFARALVDVLQTERPNPQFLAKAVTQRFGRRQFAPRASMVIKRVLALP
jgi:phosphatidylinositol alpha-1,6-mannosyltransferase